MPVLILLAALMAFAVLNHATDRPDRPPMCESLSATECIAKTQEAAQ